MAITIQQQRLIFGGYAICSVIATYYRFVQLNDISSNYYVLATRFAQGDSAIILGNLTAVITLIIGSLLQRFIFGELRLIESEHLYERSWSTIIGLLMSGSIYKSGDNILFLVIFACGLLFGKIFHCILCDRLDSLIQQYYQSTNNESVGKTIYNIVFNRIIATLLLLVKVDFMVIKSCLDESFTHKSPILILISFEFFILLMELVHSSIKYSVSVYEIYHIEKNPDEENWYYKIWIESIIKLVIDFTKSLMIPTFFIYSVSLGTFQFSLITESFRSFYGLGKSVKSILRLVQNSKKLNNLLREVNEEELDDIDMCIICRDELRLDKEEKNESKKPKKLPCGHILHDGCIRSWLQMSTACPTCRKEVFSKEGEETMKREEEEREEERVREAERVREEERRAREEEGRRLILKEERLFHERMAARYRDIPGWDQPAYDISDEDELDGEFAEARYMPRRDYGIDYDLQYDIDNGQVESYYEGHEEDDDKEEEKEKEPLRKMVKVVFGDDSVEVPEGRSSDWITLKTRESEDGHVTIPMNEFTIDIKKKKNNSFLNDRIQMMFPSQNKN